MVQLVCGCLNVRIQVKSAGQPVDPTSLDLQVKSVDEFFGQQLSEVHLNLEGIHVEHAFLVTKNICGPWIVHRCDNCRMTTHATRSSPEKERVLVGPGLLSDDQMIQRLSICPEYSSLFKIVVKETSESLPVANDWTSKEVTETMQLLQKKLSVFLVAEEQAMEERIREFQEQERENYATLQTKAKNDKNAIINTILVNMYKNVSESLMEAMKESPIGSVETSQALDVMTSVSPLSFGNYMDGGQSPNDQFSPRRPISRSESNRSKRSDKLTERTARRKAEPKKEVFGDDDDVFQYDPGFQDDPTQPPFSESDEDERHDTDDSSAAEDVGVTQRNVPANFSTSVPINVPQWGRQISHNIDITDEVDSDTAPKDAESMAASIQALARSIHGDSSRVFGELPTSRTRARVMSSQSSYRH